MGHGLDSKFPVARHLVKTEINSGSDHGSAGVAFMIGGAVNGGMYGEYPSLAEAEQIDGDLRANNDFRSVYTGILEDWMGLDAAPIDNGQFEKFDLFKS